MALTYHVTTGGVYLQVGTGAAGALETLGVPEDGIFIDITKHERPIHTDVSGPEVPADIQDFGISAVIRCSLIAYDLAVADRVERAAGQGAGGLLPAMGTLIGTDDRSFAVAIASATDEPWNFPTAKVRTYSRKPSSERNKYDISFFAWGFIPATLLTAAGVEVYT